MTSSLLWVTLSFLFIFVSAKSYYIRISRAEEPEHTFNMLGPAQFYDYDNQPNQVNSEISPHNERESFKIMEAPVSLSNPLWNMFSKMSDLYQWVRRTRRSDYDE